MPTNDWETFFDYHAPEYMDNVFVQATAQEADFLEELLQLPAGSRILEVGCGTGRHSVELTKRGYRVTAIDLSTGMLAQARKAAETAGVTVDFVQADATQYQPEPGEFDAAICLCEGAFGLLGRDDDPVDHDLAILRMVAGALKPGARFVLTALSACRMIRAAAPETVAAGAFDPLTLVESGSMKVTTPDGPLDVPTRERGFVATELTLLCRLAGLTVEHLWGGTAGNWGRRPLELDEFEIMAVARKV
jgi:SAM-dependent methyltransferase